MGLNIFIFDYPGYGHSTGGPPREKLLYEDTERPWKYLVEERNIPPSNIAIYGHSLGGAVAIDLASKHPDAGALITESAFPSIADVADGCGYAAYLPVRLILIERFDSISRIGSIHLRKLFLEGGSDSMVSPSMADRLYDAAPDPKQMALIPGGGHDDSAVVNATAYFAALNGFLSKFRLQTGGWSRKVTMRRASARTVESKKLRFRLAHAACASQQNVGNDDRKPGLGQDVVPKRRSAP